MVWLGERRGYLVDWVTQRWVQLTGARVALAEAPWLRGPCGTTRMIGDGFFEAFAAEQGLSVRPPDERAGLIGGLAELAGPGFDASAVHPMIDDFYAHTAAFDLELRSRWSGPFRVLGWLIGRIFARRLAQLNMPLDDEELAGGVRSRIIQLADEEGRVRHTGWVRTAVQTGRPVFVGQYGTDQLPGHEGLCIKVVFPLPNGNAIILLRPRVDEDGGLTLLSDGRRFGDPGFYFTVVAGSGEVWARYVRTMKETLSLRVVDSGIRATHRFRVFGMPFVELRYTITPPPRAADAQVVSGAQSTSS